MAASTWMGGILGTPFDQSNAPKFISEKQKTFS